jgi:pectate lyase
MAGRGGTTGTAGTIGRGGTTGTAGTTGSGGNISCLSNTVVGWATQNGSTTGGGSAAPMTVTTASALSSALASSASPVVVLQGNVSGSFNVPSNKTLLGACGARSTITGHIGIGARSNVIVRNLVVVGLNCTDNPDCQSGEDAVEIGQSSRVWIDHLDVSDGSDGNLDVTNASDYVTVSYTKFWYRGRSGGHQFSNLVGNSDNNPGDMGHLRVTWHHNWWADRVVERQPRVRYGQNHLYNNLWTSNGNNYCIGVGFFANILAQNNVFINVADPLDTGNYSNSSSVAHQEGNIYQGTSGMTGDLRGTSVFTPPYTVTLDPASGVEADVRANAGPK